MSLPSDARKRLAIRLLESVEVVDDEAVDAAWTDEITSRIKGIRSGDVQTMPHEEVLARLAERRANRQATRQQP